MASNLTRAAITNLGKYASAMMVRSPAFATISARFMSASAPATAPKLKRFFKKVTVGPAKTPNKIKAIEIGTVRPDQPAFEVYLDGKPLKTPLKRPLVLPTERMAMLVAAEWEMQRKHLETYTMPITGLAITATDYVCEHRNTFQKGIMKYLETDTLFHRAGDDELEPKQQEKWDPLIDWMTKVFDVPFSVTSSLLFVEQLPEAVERVEEALKNEDLWTLTALNYATATAKSIVLALAMQQNHVTPGEVFSLYRLEEDYQISNWGLVEGDHDVEMADSAMRFRASYAMMKALESS